ncbi:TetR/AcrR family transcriptional regulator [Aeromicrobium sp.]|uniref:TetR/AcrR family transcriptional regulator n=1 Tax=Aeromicrobium sp. TaxID=1871063 RepID=UPI003C320912
MSGVEVSGGARNYGGKSADERLTDRRARLVEAAITLLARTGEARTTMTAVCAEAGLTERYFYESFASRDDVLVAALDAVSAEVASVALDAVAATSGDPADRVRAAIGAVVDLVVATPDRMRVAVIESTANAALRARRHELQDTFAGLVAREARAIFGDESWPAPRDHVQGLVFIAGLSELVASWLIGEVELSPDELATTASDSLVALMRRAP